MNLFRSREIASWIVLAAMLVLFGLAKIIH